MASIYETYLRRYLNDNGTLWSSAQIERWAFRAEQEICRVFPAVEGRIQLPIVTAQPLYVFPPTESEAYPSLGISQITYRGDFVIPLSQQQAWEMFPESVVTSAPVSTPGAFEPTAFQNNAFYVPLTTGGYSTIGGQLGRPQFWAYSGYDEKTIQLFPTPNETIAYNPAPLSSRIWGGISPYCIVEYRSAQRGTLPQEKPLYRLVRMLIKDYVLSEAFGQEGKGQQIQVAEMLRKRFAKRMDLYRTLSSNIFVANKHRMGNQTLESPVFPKHPNYGNDLGRRIR